jgi:hypothetical protein
VVRGARGHARVSPFLRSPCSGTRLYTNTPGETAAR